MSSDSSNKSDSYNSDSCHDDSSEIVSNDQQKYGKILDYDIHRFSGKIKTEKLTFRWSFDDRSNCCEKYGAYKSNKSISRSALLGGILLDYDIKDVGESKCALIIKTTVGDYIHKFYNYHNGYYSHTLYVYIDGKCEMQKCL